MGDLCTKMGERETRKKAGELASLYMGFWPTWNRCKRRCKEADFHSENLFSKIFVLRLFS